MNLASTIGYYLLWIGYQAQPQTPRDAKCHTDAKRPRPAARRSRRKGLTAQQISEINRQNAMRRWRRDDANWHAANSHDPRARVISTCFESEAEVEIEKPQESIPAAPEAPPAVEEGNHHLRRKQRARRQRRAWNGNANVNRAHGAERCAIGKLGERSSLYTHCKLGFLSRRQGLYFWDWEAAFAVQRFLERHETITVGQIDAALDACFSEGARLSAKAVFDGLGRDSEQQARTYKPTSASSQAGVYLSGNWTPEAIARREKAEEENERENYHMWCGMSKSFQLANPWRGKIYAEVGNE